MTENARGHNFLEADATGEEDTMENKFLTFHLGKEDYGIEIRYVTEIIGVQKITDVPDMPDYIKGVINLRGKVIPVMDVRARFKLPARAYDDRTCIIVVQYNETAVGLVVDEVSEVANIASDQIEPPPRTNRGKSSRFFKGMGKMEEDVKILLDVERLLYDEERLSAGQGDQV
ncbi:chemotaxis protein CheW [Desulfuromonas sp. AOP6]|uniref:chemotaxis protein CheW n=1 Tax=Desulfuromonas sp. AOP6 TaxID=1566351 RepID=UPI0012792C45|nr:chemotaxis protein CheW [Desulfuromonas sp. AOP6]BCA79155.1 chemotaxis protein CheW [Desulfuromonas sp. AOP6]